MLDSAAPNSCRKFKKGAKQVFFFFCISELRRPIKVLDLLISCDVTNSIGWVLFITLKLTWNSKDGQIVL